MLAILFWLWPSIYFNSKHYHIYVCIATVNANIFFILKILSTAKPIIVLQPVGTTIHVGADKVNINCSGIGHSGLSYHWERYNFDNNEWSSLTKDQQSFINNVSIYTLTNITENDEGMYHCAATNIDGSGYSNNATITVYGMCIDIYS